MNRFKSLDRTRILFVSAILYSLLIADFVLWSGFSLGFFITVCIGQIGIFMIFHKPASRATTIFSIFLGLCILALGGTFFLYSDWVLASINFIVIAALILIQLLVYSESVTTSWDENHFFNEFMISPFIRPLKFLDSISKTGKSFKKTNQINEDSAGNSTVNLTVDSTVNSTVNVPIKATSNKTGIQILIGLAIAFPVVAVVTLLLSSADQIFGQYTKQIFDRLLNIKIKEYLFAVVFGAAIFPFLFSFLYSFYIKYEENKLDAGVAVPIGKKVAIEPTIAATFLICLNIVYGLFAWVQFGSLFGAFNNLLPADVTFAVYAREGFFQLCAVALINIVVVIISVTLVSRKQTGGIIVKIMSVLLICFTYVLLLSAGYRMNMYIDVYALSKLRVLVSLFMGLIALLLLYALIKEFISSFRFFKTAFITAILVLLLTNYLNTDRLIARYNIHEYLQKGESALINPDLDLRLARIDTDYLITGLSYDAVPELVTFAQAQDNHLSDEIRSSLKNMYENHLLNYRDNNWKRFNISKENARDAIEKLIQLD